MLNITVPFYGLREALHTPHTFFPQVQYHCVTLWPPGGSRHTTYIFPTGPISLCHSLASWRPHTHHTHFSHGFNITVSLFGLREALDTPHTFFPQVQYHCVTLWPLGGPTHTTHIFPTGSISLCHLLASYNNNWPISHYSGIHWQWLYNNLISLDKEYLWMPSCYL